MNLNSNNVIDSSYMNKIYEKMKPLKFDKTQKLIIEKFLLVFLAPIPSERKNSGNELDYITTTLDRVFKQNFGFNLDRRTIENNFQQLGYKIFHKNQTFDSDKKRYVPSINGEIKGKQVGLGTDIEPQYTYFNIDPKTIRILKRTTATLPESTNNAKFMETELMQKRILDFKVNFEGV